MAVELIPCAKTVNVSEGLAIERLRQVYGSRAGEAWYLLSNLTLSVSDEFQSDELDLVLLGERGVALVEVKHWDQAWIDRNADRAGSEAEKLTRKARRLKGFLSSKLRFPELRVEQFLLLTRDGAPPGPTMIRGAAAYGLRNAGKIADDLTGPRLRLDQLRAAVESLCPKSRIIIDGKIRSFGEYTNLELISPSEDRFHRIYRGIHRSRKEKVVLHVYDLSAPCEGDPVKLAEREFEVIRVLQRSRHVPAVREFLREAEGYPGEMVYGVLFDPCAPSLEKRRSDRKWSIPERVRFAARALRALAELHEEGQKVGFVHRNITPRSVLVTHDNQPLFVDFHLSRLSTQSTLFGRNDTEPDPEWVAPEIRERGWGAALPASDFYSLCRVLGTLFQGCAEPLAQEAAALLERGCAESPEERAQAVESLARDLERLIESDREASKRREGEEIPAEFWSEGKEISFRGDRLVVVSRLGSGGVGHTFKVERISGRTGESLGTFVAKVVREDRIDDRLRDAYERVRTASAEPGLATVFDVESEPRPNQVFALLEWVEGESLEQARGKVGTYAFGEVGESVPDLLRRWLGDACRALQALHRVKLVHGDVSSKNLVLSGGNLRLIDYDLVTREGQVAVGSGSPAFCSPEALRREPLTPSDDLYALAASLFAVLFDDLPFDETNAEADHTRVLRWAPERRAALGELAEFFDRATHPDREQRFRSAAEALAWLEAKREAEPEPERSENEVEWLSDLLTIYPGSPTGNVETRGLDSAFAEQTYVPTELEDALYEELRSRKVRLVILCGNAGDGKTALLQHLARRFGIERVLSGTRIWEATTEDGLILKANLDGAASYQGKSADDLLDEFFEPFLEGPPAEDRAHLLAINDGRLLEWLRRREQKDGGKPLVEALLASLAADDDPRRLPEYVRFVSLNYRSLVGGVDEEQREIRTEFLDRLLEKLLGGDEREDKWKPCLTCLAYDRCSAGPVAHNLLASYDPARAETEAAARGRRLRERLAEAFQAVHQRGEMHITTRELRGALSYILFGITPCRELHADPGKHVPPYYDRCFDPASEARQGDLLRELTFLDPALEAHPVLDRWLTGRTSREIPGAGPPYPGLSPDSARRRAYFEWLPQEIEAVTGSPEGHGLAGGGHLAAFRAASLSGAEGNRERCEQLCRGIAMLEELPPAAFRSQERIPLRVPGRNPTETIFWIEKPLDRFRLEPERPPVAGRGIPWLPNRLRLVYRYQDDREEVLSMGYGLFHVLLSLAEGEQLMERRTDDLFANLRIFVQRLSMEDGQEWFAWHPRGGDSAYRLAVRREEGVQKLVLETCGRGTR